MTSGHRESKKKQEACRWSSVWPSKLAGGEVSRRPCGESTPRQTPGPAETVIPTFWFAFRRLLFPTQLGPWHGFAVSGHVSALLSPISALSSLTHALLPVPRPGRKEPGEGSAVPAGM